MTRKIATGIVNVVLALGLAGICPTAAAPPASATDVRPLLIGAKVPELTLSSADGSPFDLTRALATKPTILIFYRGGW